ncbi:MAG TPA: metallophosphoesterase [Polyangiaceae bacterium]|nr:metallophosphoesterase [Polyangiaceae bacterium]
MLVAGAEPLLILSDVHLNYNGSQGTGEHLALLTRRSQGAELVLAGDIFDLSRESPGYDPAEAIASLLRHHHDVRAAFRDHLSAGHRVSLIAGNHDAAVGEERLRKALLATLDVQSDARLELYPWFIRRGGVHIEHGHLYDPDNAPSHPLATWSYSTEPLGIALTRRFLAPSGALQLAHAHETTPVRGLIRAYELFGARAPLVVAQYFATAIRLCLEAGRQEALTEERERGRNALPRYAELTGVPLRALAELVRAGAEPTHHRFTDTFMRLYFDRVVATLSLLFGASTFALRKSPVAAAVTALSGTYLGASVKRGKSRYSGVIEQRLRDAAGYVVRITGAELVIFGHTHSEDDAPCYLNSGSFGYARNKARPYIWIEPGRSAERRHFTA